MTDDTDAPDAPETAPEIDFAAELLARDEEIASLKDRLLRAAAETENVRRRLERDKADASAYAVTGFARDLLGVADNLRRAVAAIPADAREHDAVKPIVGGIEATEKELQTVFARHGIARVAAAGALDPHRHQAMIEVDSDAHAPGEIVQELQAGYTLKERLLRPALVSVARPRADAA